MCLCLKVAVIWFVFLFLQKKKKYFIQNCTTTICSPCEACSFFNWKSFILNKSYTRRETNDEACLSNVFLWHNIPTTFQLCNWIVLIRHYSNNNVLRTYKQCLLNYVYMIQPTTHIQNWKDVRILWYKSELFSLGRFWNSLLPARIFLKNKKLFEICI